MILYHAGCPRHLGLLRGWWHWTTEVSTLSISPDRHSVHLHARETLRVLSANSELSVNRKCYRPSAHNATHRNELLCC